ncbi:MAG: S24/S26 family peptidase [Bacteroidales bacterium]|jgi:hypothetical protein|nr:S24/S26 family peptidase [Bacteroidales bacterium]
MNRCDFVDNMVLWINDNIDLIGMDQTNTFSPFFFWDSYGKLCYICKITNNMKIFNILEVLKRRLDSSIFTFDYIGVLIILAYYWEYLIYYNEMPVTLSFIKEKLIEYSFHDYNKFEPIDRLKCLLALNISKKDINKSINDALIDLSNVRHFKYRIVDRPEYNRKIHNSFHYCSPYTLLYQLSRLQCQNSFLPKDAKIIIDNVIIDGYNNIDKLNLLDMSLLLASSPSDYNLNAESVFRLMTDNFFVGKDMNPYYYDNLFFGNRFVNSSMYTAVTILECYLLAGKFAWKPFLDESMIGNKLEVKQNITNFVDTYKSSKRLIMKKDCMAPILEDGDEFDVTYDIDAIKKDDIIVFRHYSGKIMAHRVIDIIHRYEKRVYITAADNGGLWGYPVFKRDIIGIVNNIIKMHRQCVRNK